MKLRMWTLDVAREQSPSYEGLRAWCRLSLDAGYNAIGLYLEHRFVYASAPWAAGKGALEPEVVQRLQSEFPDLQIIPFINLLGHFEGFLYTEEGSRFAEEAFRGMQANPLHPEFNAFCRGLIDDTLAAFSSEIVHLGGDETAQLGAGPASGERVRAAESEGASDGKAVLYGEHFGPLAQYVLDQGRRPALWADMFEPHPDALTLIPQETLLFDWQYFSGPNPPASDHEKVYCPTLHTYNALWCHLPQSERNVVEHAAAAERDGAYGVCVTTWECGLLGNYNTLKPAIRASGGILLQKEESPSSSSQGSKPGAFEHIIFDRDPDLVPTNDFSLAVGIADNILMNLLQSKEDRGSFVKDGDLYRIFFGVARVEAGTLPLESAVATARRLRLLAGIPAHNLQARDPGKITGTIDGEAFEIQISSVPDGLTPAIEMRVLVSPLLRILEPQRAIVGNISLYAESKDAPRFLKAYLQESETSEEWARLLGCELQEAGGLFAFGNIRSSIKARLLLYSNPFLLYLRNGDDLFSASGEQALGILERAATFATGPDERGPVWLGIKALEFVRQCRRSHLAYAERKPGEAINHLAPCRQIFEDLEKIAVATSINADGSLADVERCRAARRHIDLVIGRIKQYGDGSLGYLPSFATITHPKFVPHDQANWWLINTWANE